MSIWWGLYENGRLLSVISRFNRPSIFDFGMPISSEYNYEISEVEINQLD
jgi:hypothetical protein